MHEVLLVSGASQSEIADLVDMTKRWLLDQRRPVFLPTAISMSGDSEHSCLTVSINAASFCLCAPFIVEDVVINDTMQQEQWSRRSCAFHSMPSSHSGPRFHRSPISCCGTLQSFIDIHARRIREKPRASASRQVRYMRMSCSTAQICSRRSCAFGILTWFAGRLLDQSHPRDVRILQTSSYA